MRSINMNHMNQYCHIPSRAQYSTELQVTSADFDLLKNILLIRTLLLISAFYGWFSASDTNVCMQIRQLVNDCQENFM